MKLDAHVHTLHSGMSTIWPLSLIMRESYNTPQRAYRLAKARGMDLVAITDHDVIAGALELAHLPDVIVGCEVSATFPGENIGEARFNHSLLFDLVAHPAVAGRANADLPEAA